MKVGTFQASCSGRAARRSGRAAEPSRRHDHQRCGGQRNPGGRGPRRRDPGQREPGAGLHRPALTAWLSDRLNRQGRPRSSPWRRVWDYAAGIKAPEAGSAATGEATPAGPALTCFQTDRPSPSADRSSAPIPPVPNVAQEPPAAGPRTMPPGAWRRRALQRDWPTTQRGSDATGWPVSRPAMRPLVRRARRRPAPAALNQQVAQPDRTTRTDARQRPFAASTETFTGVRTSLPTVEPSGWPSAPCRCA